MKVVISIEIPLKLFSNPTWDPWLNVHREKSSVLGLNVFRLVLSSFLQNSNRSLPLTSGDTSRPKAPIYGEKSKKLWVSRTRKGAALKI